MKQTRISNKQTIITGIILLTFCSLFSLYSYSAKKSYENCGNRYDEFIESLLSDPATVDSINQNETVKTLAIQLQRFEVTGYPYHGYNQFTPRAVYGAVFGILGLVLIIVGILNEKYSQPAIEPTRTTPGDEDKLDSREGYF